MALPARSGSGPSQIPLRVPKELHADIQSLAEEQGVSMNQLLIYMVSSKVAEMKQSQEFFAQRTKGRSKQSAVAGLNRFLDEVPTDAPVAKGDELPGSLRPKPNANKPASKRKS